MGAKLIDALPGSRDRCSKCFRGKDEHGPYWFLEAVDDHDNAILLCRSCWQDAIRVFDVVTRKQFEEVTARAKRAEEYAAELEQIVEEVHELRRQAQAREDRILGLVSENEAVKRTNAQLVAGEPRRRRDEALAQVKPRPKTKGEGTPA